MKWVPLTTAPDQLSAEILVQALRDAEIPSIVDPRDGVSFLGVHTRPCRVLVEEDWLAKGQALLAEWEEEVDS